MTAAKYDFSVPEKRIMYRMVVRPRDKADRMIEHLAGVRHELAQDFDVHATARALRKFGGHLAYIVGTESLVDEPLGVHMPDVLALDLAVLLGHHIDDNRRAPLAP